MSPNPDQKHALSHALPVSTRFLTSCHCSQCCCNSSCYSSQQVFNCVTLLSFAFQWKPVYSVKLGEPKCIILSFIKAVWVIVRSEKAEERQKGKLWSGNIPQRHMSVERYFLDSPLLAGSPECPKCQSASDTDLAKVSPGDSDSVGGIGEMQPGSDIYRTTRAPRFNPRLI